MVLESIQNIMLADICPRLCRIPSCFWHNEGHTDRGGVGVPIPGFGFRGQKSSRAQVAEGVDVFNAIYPSTISPLKFLDFPGRPARYFWRWSNGQLCPLITRPALSIF